MVRTYKFPFISWLWKFRVRKLLLLFLFLFGCSGELNLGLQTKALPIGTDPEQAGKQSLSQGPEPGIDSRMNRIIRLYGKTIRKQAREYDFDWRFILAIMKQESQFVSDATSHRGAYGLMQLMPVTSYEVADALGYEQSDLSHPRNNIAGGIYYFRKLYELFNGAEPQDRLRLTLAAYNSGASRVYDAQDIAAYLGDNPHRWSAIRDVLPLLSKRYNTLHQHVWDEAKPRSGFFGEWQQTVNYVENVMAYYEQYRHALE